MTFTFWMAVVAFLFVCWFVVVLLFRGEVVLEKKPLEGKPHRHRWAYIGSPPLAKQCRDCSELEYLNEEMIPEGFKEYVDALKGGEDSFESYLKNRKN